MSVGSSAPAHERSVRRADDVLTMQRLAVQRGSTQALLAWLSGRTGFWTALVDRSGRLLRSAAPAAAAGTGRADEARKALVAAGAAKAAAQRLGPVVLDGVVDGQTHTAYLVRTGGSGTAPLLAAVGRVSPQGLPVLLTDAACTIGLCWQAEVARHTLRRARVAEDRSREAVLHLLMIGEVPTAHRIAAALRPPLPERSRVCVIECPPERREEVAELCQEAAGGRLWVVPCPVRFDHFMALLPVEDGQSDCLEEAVVSAAEGCRVGVSEVVGLREVPVGYEQAFHALAVIRNRPCRHARFSPRSELAPLLGERGLRWAAAVLEPLLAHVPQRKTDPGVEELLATVNSWLYFGSGAPAHLKVHRNTLAARIRLVEELLGRDLGLLAEQAVVSLALRLHGLSRRHAHTSAPDPSVTLEDLLAAFEVRHWAGLQIQPLTQGGPPSGLATLRTWLKHDARLGPTAAALGISVPGVRKRLTRVEEALQRSLLQAPSAKYDLWLALRARGEL